MHTISTSRPRCRRVDEVPREDVRPDDLRLDDLRLDDVLREPRLERDWLPPLRTDALRRDERREVAVPLLRRCPRELLERERLDRELRLEDRLDLLDPELRLRRELLDPALRRFRRDEVPDARREAERLRPEERRRPRDCDGALRELVPRALPRARPRLLRPSSADRAVSRDTSLLKLLF
jgi:hypothetical protein